MINDSFNDFLAKFIPKVIVPRTGAPGAYHRLNYQTIETEDRPGGGGIYRKNKHNKLSFLAMNVTLNPGEKVWLLLRKFNSM